VEDGLGRKGLILQETSHHSRTLLELVRPQGQAVGMARVRRWHSTRRPSSQGLVSALALDAPQVLQAHTGRHLLLRLRHTRNPILLRVSMQITPHTLRMLPAHTTMEANLDTTPQLV